MRIPVDDSTKNIELYYGHLNEIKDKVNSYASQMVNGFVEPEVMPGLDKLRAETALRLVQLQNSNRVIAWSDVLSIDKGRIQELQKKHKISREEVIGLLVKNAVYKSYSQIEIENYFEVLKDIDRVYNQYAAQSKVMPLNALSKRTSDILKQYRVGVSVLKKVELIIKTFRPNMSGVKLLQYDYTQTIKPAFYLSDEDLAGLAREVIDKFADKLGNIDNIFASKNEDYLKKLITVLKLNHITFDSFANRYSLFYTKCYSVDSVFAGKQMLMAYHDRYGTYRGLQKEDGYLCKKIDMVKSLLHKYSMVELLEYWGIDSDNQSSYAKLTDNDLINIESQLIEELSMLYPDKLIDKGFPDKNRPVYEKARMLAHRKHFVELDNYLLSLGFKRIKTERKTFKNKFCLSERDLIYYGFISPKMTADELNQILKTFNIEFLNVEDYIGFYRRLAYNKQDGPGWAELKAKKQFGEGD